MKKTTVSMVLVLLFITRGLLFAGVADHLWHDNGDGSISPASSRSVAIGSTKRVSTLAQWQAAEADAGISQVILNGSVALTAHLTITKRVKIEAGGLITLGNYNFTAPDPTYIDAPPGQQVFDASGSGTPAFSAAGNIHPGWYGFSASATGANNATYLGDVITGMTAGSNIVIQPGSYTLAGNVTISKACKIRGYGATFSWASDTTANRGLLVTVSNVKIYGLKLDGPQHVTSVTTQNGIHAYGADSSNYITGFKVRDCEITDWGQYGIKMDFVQDFEIAQNYIHALCQAGIGGLSVKQGIILGNTVEDIDTAAGGGKYGIIVSRINHGSLVTIPRSKDILVQGNTVRNITNWEGLDTHGGERISFVGNEVYGCAVGITIGGAANEIGTATWGALDCTASNNIVDSGVTDGSRLSGINFVGCASELSTGVISNNIIRGYGSDGAVGNAAAIYYGYTNGLIINGNVIITPSQYGIRADSGNYGVSITGNTIRDAWANTGTESGGIKIDGTANTGIITGNTMRRTGDMSAKAHDYEYAIIIDNVDGNYLDLGKNYTYGINRYFYDTGDKALRGMMYSNVDTSGTDECNLRTITIPDDTLTTGKRITVVGRGIKIGANNNKTIKFYFGGVAYTAIPAANDQLAWEIRATIIVDAYNSQRIGIVGISGTSIVYNAFADGAVDMTGGDVTVKFTGQCVHADDIVRQYMMDVMID